MAICYDVATVLLFFPRARILDSGTIGDVGRELVRRGTFPQVGPESCAIGDHHFAILPLF